MEGIMDHGPNGEMLRRASFDGYVVMLEGFGWICWDRWRWRCTWRETVDDIRRGDETVVYRITTMDELD